MLKNLKLQVSAKQSVAFKAAGQLFKAIQTVSKFEIDTPQPTAKYVGLTKKDKLILFEMEGSEPKAVWHKSTGDESWSKSDFLGYPIIEEYTLEELQNKTNVLKEFVQAHWKKVSEQPQMAHGDLTHLNVLWDGNKVALIDEKEASENPLCDVFSMYAYLKQCYFDHQALGSVEKSSAFSNIDEIFSSALRANDHEISNANWVDLQEQQFPGIRSEFRGIALGEFSALFQS